MAAYRGDRGAQFVTGVGGEAAQPFLAGVAFGEGVLDVAEHAVERAGDLAHLTARVGFRGSRGEGHLPAGQREFADPGGGRGDPAERAQGPAHPQGARDAGGGEGGTEDDPGDQYQAVDGGLDGLQGHPGDQDVTVQPPGGEHPVVGQRGEVDAVAAAVDRDRREPPAVTGAQIDGQGAAGPDDGRVGDRAVHQPGSERPRGLAAGVGAVVAVVVVLQRFPLVFQADREAVPRLGELLVETAGEEALQSEHRGEADRGTAHRQQHHQAEGEPGPQGVRPQVPHGVTGLITYPAPRTVWIIGSRPASTFLRR
ncbi:hypothetical protein RKD19_006677 [Streptomyces canus]